MKTKQAGGGVQYLYESEQEIEEAAKKANAELKYGHSTLFFPFINKSYNLTPIQP